MEYRMSTSLITTPLVFCPHRHLVKASMHSQCLPTRLRVSCIYRDGFHRSTFAALPSSPKIPCPVGLPSTVRPLRCVGNTASHFASTGGDGGFGGDCGGGGEGGGDGSDGRDAESNSAAAGVEDASAASSDVIILDVGGMTCGGCAASVKRILENQPQVTSASVNLTTETAVIWPISEAKAVPNWQKELGDALAKHLTNCGFTSALRGQEAIEGDMMP